MALCKSPTKICHINSSHSALTTGVLNKERAKLQTNKQTNKWQERRKIKKKVSGTAKTNSNKKKKK